MKWLIYLFISVVTLGISYQSAFAQNNPQSDYRYQLDQYRRYYSEYQIFKSDYLKNTSLDNEQKAMLSARSAIVARELTLSSLVRIISSSIRSYNLQHPAIIVSLSELNSLLDFYAQQANQAKTIQTKKELAKYTSNYLSSVSQNQVILDRAEIINKIAQILNSQQQADRAKAILDTQLKNRSSEALVRDGLDEAASLQSKIRSDISAVIKKAQLLNPKTKQQNSLQKVSKQLSQINSLQLRLINRIIDLDTNYVKH